MDSLCDQNFLPVLDASSMRRLDALSKAGDVEKGYAFMRLAGESLSRYALEILGENLAEKTVAILVGKGNNGGDGLVCAEYLFLRGVCVKVFSLIKKEDFRLEASLAYRDLARILPEDSFIVWDENASEDFSGFSLLIDALLGLGARGELRSPYREAVLSMNKSGVPILSVDCPTGFDEDAFCAGSACICAKETVVFGMPRLSPLTSYAAKFFGKIRTEILPYSKEDISEVAEDFPKLAQDFFIESLLPKRNESSDKRGIGVAFILAGSKNMPGASALAAESALRSGTGLLTLSIPETIFPILAGKLSEPVFCPFQDGGMGILTKKNLPEIYSSISHASALGIGPGLSSSKEVGEALLELLPKLKVPTVLDADALNAIASFPQILKECRAPLLLTPHEREFARLFGELPDGPFERVSLLKSISKEWGVSILLKSHPVMLSLGNGEFFIVSASNSGLSKGGSGDVLFGIIVSLLSQGVEIPRAALLGILLHRRAGFWARKKWSAFSMLPSDLISMLPKAFQVSAGELEMFFG